MSFPTDGSSHKVGIKNEEITRDFLRQNAYKIFDDIEKEKYTVDPLGGTTHKADNVIISDDGHRIEISDKHKKNLSNGSVDWINTGTLINEMIESGRFKSIKEIKEKVKEIRQKSLSERKKALESFRKEVSNAGNEALRELDSSDLTESLYRYVIKPNEYLQILITEGKSEKRFLWHISQHPVVGLLEDGYVPTLKIKKNVTSAPIKFVKGDEEIDCGLRIRIMTNNGVTALLNAGGYNKNSQFVLKIQQDKVHTLLDDMGVTPIAV
tara:strand:- start:653 stop:1453 length:801 start_codon:yes stop_codon:yes gene_type:complete